MKNKLITFILFAGILSGSWAQTKTVVAYQYWFDNNFASRTTVSVSPIDTLNLNIGLPVNGLQDGIVHYLHIRFKDSAGRWSGTQTQMINNSQPLLSQYQYWYDGVAPTFTSVAATPLIDLDVALPAPVGGTAPYNSLNLRFKDNRGNWGPTISSNVWNHQPEIASFEYWLNDSYDQKIGHQVGTQTILINQALELPPLDPGMAQNLNIRFKDKTGNYSATHTSKLWNPGHTLASYEFWLDRKFAKVYSGEMGGQATENWIYELDLDHHNRFDSLHVRFKDIKGNPSGTLSMASPPPIANFYFIKDRYWASFNNTSLLGTSFKWLFGDGQESTQVNPSYHFADPGEWEVCLVATNNSGKDTICQYVSIRGIQAVMPSKVGNGGAATITIIGGGLTPNAVVTLEGNGLPTFTASEVYLDSPGRLKSRFDLFGQQTGLYDLKVTLPDTVMIKQGVVQIEEAVPVEFFADLSGRDVVLINRWQTYTVNYGNLGNNDLAVAPLWIVVSDVTGLELQFLSKTIDIPLNSDPTWMAIADSIKPWFTIDSLGPDPFKARVYPLFLPRLAANESGSFTVRVKSPANFRIITWVNPDWYVDTKLSDYQRCVMWAQATALANGLVSLIGTQIPGASCVGGIGLTLMSYDYDNASLGSAMYSITKAAIDCVFDLGSQIPIIKAWTLTKEILSLASNIYDNYEAAESCKKKFKQDKPKDKDVRTVTSWDPNEIVGPVGFAEARYNNDNIKYPYQIYFENLSTATAPAQEVFVYDTLDITKYDLASFELGNISFSDNIVYIPAGLKEFSTDIDLRPQKDIILRINAWLDEDAGVANWVFASFDPTTMDLTEDPFGGFLPPNVNSPEGEGYVSFSINLLPNQPHNSQISNKATIVFDLNKPIVTNTWVNSIDKLPPTTSVNPLQAQNNGTTVEVSWSGSDAHSGLDHFSIYYSKDGAAPQPLIVQTKKQSAIFEGEEGSTYRFYSLGTDLLGNQEVFNGIYQATTTLYPFVSVTENPYVPFFLVYPNPATNNLTVSFQHIEPGLVEIYVFDMLGRKIQHHSLEVSGSEVVQLPINVSSLPSGSYVISLKSSKTIINRLTVIRK